MKNPVIQKVISLIFILVFFYSLSINSGSFLGLGKKSVEKPENNFDLTTLKTLFNDAASYKSPSPDRAIVLDKSGKQIGQVLQTLPTCESIRGFAGPIPMLIALDSNDKVATISVLANKETPAFINRVLDTGILNKWKNQTASDAVLLGVDAVTGATMSSSCIIKSVRTRLASHAAVSVKETEEQNLQQNIESLAWIFLLISLLAYIPNSPIIKYRKSYLVVTILIPGFLLGRFMSLGLLQAWAIDGIPYSTQLYMTVLMALAIFLPILFGKSYYCTWYCPFGAAQELCMHILKYKYNPSPKLASYLRKLRPLLVLIIIGIVIAGVKADLYLFEPFAAFLFKSASTITLILTIVILLLSLVIRKPWCTYCCPTGCFLEASRHITEFGPIKKIQIVKKEN